MATNENGDEVPPAGGGDFPVPDLRTMEELFQPTLNGRGEPIAPIAIQATNFGLKNDMIQQPPLAKLRTYMLREPIINVEDLKGITTRSGIAYKGPTIPTTSSPPKVVERETEVTKDMVPPTNNESTKDNQPSVVQVETQIPNFEPVVAPVVEPVGAPVSAPKPNPRPSIPYPFADALILMPKFSPTIKSLLTNKVKLIKLARTPLNEYCSAVLLKKLPKKLGDPRKFLISCDFLGMIECLALADLGTSINLMPLFVWNKLSLPELSPTCMTLELADRSISCPNGVAKDVFVKVGKFYFLAEFVVVDFDVDPRVPLILERSFLKIERALIDVYEGELTLRAGNKAIIFNLDQTLRYSANYDAESINQIDVINVACEEYSQEILEFSVSGNPTPSMELIVSISSPTLTPFGDSNFLLEETDAFLATKDEPISSEIDDSYFDSKGDILLLEEFLNDDPSSPPLPPQVLKVVEPKNEKSSIDEPAVVELKDLPSYLKYAFLEGDDKLSFIIAKDLKDKEKTALIKVLKSHKQALAWQLSNIKGINLEFYTYKILIEDDFKPAVQHQKRVNPKIHEVIEKEVLKLLDAELIYLISDSPWVSPVHCVPKKGGFTVVENEENELLSNSHRPQDQEKTTFTCPYGMFAYRRMPFGLCNAPCTFQMCMMAIFHDMIEKTMEVFMDDFSVFRISFKTCLSHLDKMLKRCEDTNLCLNWEKIHFMVKEGIVLGHKISKNGIEIAWPMTRLLEKDTPFIFSKECIGAFQSLKKKLTEALILVTPDWDLPFELLCDASDFTIAGLDHSPLPKYSLMEPSSYLKLMGQISRKMVIDSSTTLEGTYHLWLSRISKPSPRTNEFVDRVKLSDLKQALRRRIARILKTRACSYVLRSLDLHILSFILGIQYPNLID
nr:DNA-directed DNA polymerase [Tanacetum cinerariifolium]